MRPQTRLEHMILLGWLVSLLVAGLLYAISPAEVDVVLAAARDRLVGKAGQRAVPAGSRPAAHTPRN